MSEFRSQNPLNDTKMMILIGIVALFLVSFLVLIIVKSASLKNQNAGEEVSSGIPAGSEIASEDNPEKATFPTGNGVNDTGEFSLYATEREGRKGTGEYNYGEALQKSILFYELQRSGDLPDKTRCNWRGDSALTDGSDVGIDLTGGLYDAGDHVKFNLPMAYTASVLAWSYYENEDAYTESKQDEYMRGVIRWIDDYLMKCHSGKEEFYYQVGNGGTDHSWWGPCEVMTMERPAYKVDAKNPGSTVTAEAAAALASASVIFKDSDPDYSKKCLEHAKELYAFSAKYKSDAGYTQAAGFYDSHSGFYDELSFAATWLYLATGEEQYKKDAKEYFAQTSGDYKWTLCWDDVSLGTALIMGRETKDRKYLDYLENNLDYWTTGVGGERITYTPKGLAWLDAWGSLRYASTASFLALTYSNSDICPKDKKKTYHDFAVAQIGYCLGSTGFSYEIGFGDSYPVHPHHRTAQGSPSNNLNDPAESKHVLCGALVGGPDASDGYTDEVGNYTVNEVADDYNAGFTGALAALYKEYGGETIVKYGAVENVPDGEITVEGCINVEGDNFIEVKAYVKNQSAWPARSLKDAKLCYFIDLSEIYEAGGSVADLSLQMNYSQGGSVSEVLPFDEEKHIYYVPVSFGDTVIAPGSQDSYRKEVQFRITSSKGWKNENDYSFADIQGTGGNAYNPCLHMALYEGDTLVYGSVPDGNGSVEDDPKNDNPGNDNPGNDKPAEQPKPGNEKPSDPAKPADPPKPNDPQKPADPPKPDEPKKPDDPKPQGGDVKDGDFTLQVDNQSNKGTGSTIALNIKLTNNSKKDIDLSDLTIQYYFSDPDLKNLCFYCDYASVEGKQYRAVTEAVEGAFEKGSSSDSTASVKLRIGLKGREVLQAGHTLNLQIRVARADWGNMNFDDDYSAKGTYRVTVEKGGNPVLGTRPE